MPGISPRKLRKSSDPQTTSTRIIVEFYTWSQNGFVGSTANAKDRNVVGTPIGVSYGKTFGSASGSFTISMKRPQVNGDKRVTEFDYQTLWRDPESVWVMIRWLCDGSEIDGMLGMIDNVRSNTTRNEGASREETYEIVGRDFGKVFEDTITFINPKAGITLNNFSFLVKTLSPLLALSTPADFTKKLIEAWVGNAGESNQAWELPPGLKGKGETFFKMLSFTGVEKMSMETHGAANSPRLIDPNQSGTALWDLLQYYSNGILNELWVDLAPSLSGKNLLSKLVPTVFLRERPFPTKDGGDAQWQNLRTWSLERSDIRTRNIAKGGAAGRFNYWVLAPGGYGMPEMSGFMQRGVFEVSSGFPGGIPIVNLQSVRRFGLRKWEQQTIFAPSNLSNDPSNDAAKKFTGISTEAWVQLVAGWLKKVHDWYAITPWHLSGTLVLSRAFPEIRIGHRIFESTDGGDGIYYYVEGVEHAWRYPGSGQTVLTVTRGQYLADDLLSIFYNELTGHIALEAAAQEALEASIQTKDTANVDGFDPSMVNNSGGT